MVIADDAEPALLEPNRQQGQSWSSPRMGADGDAQVTRFFDGLAMVDPGLLQVHRWRPGSAAPDDGEQIPGYAGLARKPG